MATTIAPDMYVMARRGYACVRLLPTVDVTLCGRLGDRRPVDFSDAQSPRYVHALCATCTTAHASRTNVNAGV